MAKAIITYRGWAGHFICASRCLFRLNTLIEVGEVRVVVSTVGLLEDQRSDFQGAYGRFMEIGYERHFETMAFHAKFVRNKFWDADVKREIEVPGVWSFSNIDSELEANANHVRIVEELAAKMEAGATFEKGEVSDYA